MAAGDPPLIGQRSAGALRGALSAALQASGDPTTGAMLLRGRSGGGTLGVPGAEPPSQLRRSALLVPERFARPEHGAGIVRPRGRIDPGWIAQRHPTGAGSAEFGNPYDPANVHNLRADYAAMQLDPQFLEDAAHKVRHGIPNLTDEEKARTPHEVMQALHQHMAENALFLHDMQDPEIAGISAGWYPGANKISRRDIAQMFGLPMTSATGMIAATSPQTEWNTNVERARRIAHILTHARDKKFDKNMMETARDIYREVYLPNEETGKVRDKDLLKRLDGKRLDELSPADMAAWIRAYDETYPERQALPGAPTPTAYQLYHPGGDPMGWMRNSDTGKPYSRAWGNLNQIEAAVRSYLSKGDIAEISKAMGDKHKVRNFYNDIYDPWSPLFNYTSDTHDIAGKLLTPYGGTHPIVSMIMGGAPASKVTGVKGLYGLAADAGRNAAAERGWRPNQFQSIMWEAAQGLFPEELKTAKLIAEIQRMWGFRHSVDPNLIREDILHMMGGIRPPAWYGRAGSGVR